MPDFIIHGVPGSPYVRSAAISRYLDRILAGPALTPTAARREARMNQLLGIVDW